MLNVQQVGNPEGSELVLIHGWGMHSGVWVSLIPLLKNDFHLTLIDLPGLGNNAECLPAPYTLESVICLLAEVAPDKAGWLGWSLGGVVAMAFAHAFPDRVTKLITLATNPCFVSRDDWSPGMDETVYAQFENALEQQPAKTLQRFNMLQTQGSASARNDIKALKQLMTEAEPTATGLCQSLTLLRGDYRELYRKSEQPQLHLLCELDTLAPVSLQQSIKELQPGATVVVLKGHSHIGFLSDPELVAEVIQGFLR